MTNKPMLSVELRALLESISNGAYCKPAVMAELRALLDEPDEPFNPQGWSIDHSAGRPILMHNKCSVIEAEQAYGLLNLIETAAQRRGGVTLEQVLKAYDYANSHPHKYLRGTTNWCAAVAHALNVQHPAPVADHTQCEECKGWGYHENHHEGGGTECGECGGSGNATVVMTGEQILEAMRQSLTDADGGYVFDTAKDDVIAAGRALLEVARLNWVKS